MMGIQTMMTIAQIVVHSQPAVTGGRIVEKIAMMEIRIIMMNV